MQSRFFKGISPEGFHNISYSEWGTPNKNPSILCVHGNSRNKSDFTFFAEALETEFHSVALDLVGRGKSDWLKRENNYSYHQYILDLNALISRIDVPEIYWIGSSMGGLLGMMIASMQNTPISKLIMNDIGPYIPKFIVDRMQQSGNKFTSNSFEEAAAFLKNLHALIGNLTKEQWEHFTQNTIVQEPNGKYTFSYDPFALRAFVDDLELKKSGKMIADETGNIFFWEFWDKISCPVLIIHGERSELLPHTIIKEMRQRGPKFDYYMIKGAGHAPALMDSRIINHIRSWCTDHISKEIVYAL